MRSILLGPVPMLARERKALFRSVQLTEDDLLVGVDGGAQVWMDEGYTPHFVVGDWDSLKTKKILSRLPHLSLSRSKDRSDLFFGVYAAIQAGADDLVCLGVTGGRPDHHLAVLYDLSTFSTGVFGSVKSVQALGVDGEYFFLSEKISSWKKSHFQGRLTSLFAMGAPVRGLTLKGFDYPLRDATLGLSSHGLSNRIKSKICEVHLRKGQLLVILPHNVAHPDKQSKA